MIKKRLFLTLPLIFILVFLIVQSFNRGISSVFYINFDYFVTPPISIANLNKAQSLLNSANSFSANNPLFYQYNGVLKTWQSNKSLTIQAREKLMEEAVDDYIKSIVLQPDNPITWLNLAQNSYYQGNKNYLLYLEQALKYGQSDQLVLLVYFNLSLVNWKQMDRKNQDKLVKLLQKTILAKDFLFKDSGQQLNSILVSHHLKSKLCAKMSRSKKIRAFCHAKYKY